VVSSDGVITSVVAQPDQCEHSTGVDSDHPELGAITVQLMPFDDTPNRGGVYKVWATPIENYACDLSTDTVDCTDGTHGFIHAFSKTDNFKVRVGPIREIDTWFLDANTREHLSGQQSTWIDTVGVTNSKWSYFVTFWNVTEAHV